MAACDDQQPGIPLGSFCPAVIYGDGWTGDPRCPDVHLLQRDRVRECRGRLGKCKGHSAAVHRGADVRVSVPVDWPNRSAKPALWKRGQTRCVRGPGADTRARRVVMICAQDAASSPLGTHCGMRTEKDLCTVLCFYACGPGTAGTRYAWRRRTSEISVCVAADNVSRTSSHPTSTYLPTLS